MAAFGNAGLGQFGQDLNYQMGSGNGGFLLGLAVQKTGLEDYLNKNLGVSYSGGKLSAYKQPDGSIAPDVNPYANTGMPANQSGSVPPTSVASQIPTANYDSMPGALDSIRSMGHDILNAGKNAIVEALL